MTPIDVIVPVYRDAHATRRCIESVLGAANDTPYALIVIDDASPEAEIKAYLATLAGEARVSLMENATNLGFVATVNRALALHDDRDVVLLNSDTEVASGWLDRLRQCAQAQDDVGTVTPFSNNATICAYPRCCADNPLPDGMSVADLDAVFKEVNAGACVDLPTGVGFCMYIRRACLEQVGHLDEAGFGRGYGEENDFSLRAAAKGWRNVLCADAFVYHQGGCSFADEREKLISQASEVLRQRYPDYTGTILRFMAEDSPGPLRRAVDIELARRRMARARGQAEAKGAITLHVTHDMGGGIESWVSDFIEAEAEGRNLVLKAFSEGVSVGDGLMLLAHPRDTEPLRVWRLDLPIVGSAESHPEYRRILDGIVREYDVGAVLVSSLIGHSLDILDTGLPTLVVAHDYYPLCPAINMYFGGICDSCDASRLVRCTAENTDFNPPELGMPFEARASLRACFVERVLKNGVGVVAPSHAARQHWLRLAPELSGAAMLTIPHGHGHDLPRILPGPVDDTSRLKVMILGMLSVSKGSRLLDEALPGLLEFADIYLVGAREVGALYAGRAGVHVVDEYRLEDLPGIVAMIRPDVGVLLSIWPETFSYTLSELFLLGVPPAASNVGAFAERILAGYSGFLFEANAAALLDCLRALNGNRTLLREVAANLATLPARVAEEMVADYRQLLPRRGAPASPPAPAARPDALDARSLRLARQTKQLKRFGLKLDIQHLAARRAADAYRHDISVTQARLGDALSNLATHRLALIESRQTVEDLERHLDEQTRALDERARTLAALEAHAQGQAQHILDLRAHIQHREAELVALVGSTSWRVTRPLRWFGNQVRRARILAHCLLPMLREPGLWHARALKFYRVWRVGGLRAVKHALLRLPAQAHYQDDWRDYRHAFEQNVLPEIKLRARKLPRRPRISILLPTYNTPETLLRETLDSVRAQVYPDWELCVADDGSSEAHVARVLREYAARDKRIRLDLGADNRGVAAASNRALVLATGEFCVLLDHDDLLEPQALFRVAESLIADVPDMLYSDEALISLDGKNIKHLAFRPSFSPEYLRSHPYFVHMAGFRTALLRELGGFDEGLAISQDYDLFLRATEKAGRIVHIPEILYRWRIHETSSGHARMQEVMATSRAVLQRHLDRCGEDGWIEDGPGFNFFSTRYRLAPDLRVAIIIPTKNHGELVRQCIDSLRRTIRDVAYDVVVIDHESTDPDSLAYFDTLHDSARVMRYVGPFNFSAINNWAVAQLLPAGTYSHYLLCNNDIEAIREGWLERMLELGQKPDVGIVGAKLFYPDGKTIQHAGVCVGGYGAAEHYAKQLVITDPSIDLGYYGRLSVNHEMSAVTAACLLIRRDAFEEIGGFDEQIAVGFGDVDLCLRVLMRGWRILYCPYAELLHHESFTRGTSTTDPHPEDSAFYLAKWRDFLAAGDPYYNPNLDVWSMAWGFRHPMTVHLDVARRVYRRDRARQRQTLSFMAAAETQDTRTENKG
jgi:GT2 family glycosyltransferase